MIFYDSLDEMSPQDRPSQDIINCDALLDLWLKERETAQALGQSISGRPRGIPARASQVVGE